MNFIDKVMDLFSSPTMETSSAKFSVTKAFRLHRTTLGVYALPDNKSNFLSLIHHLSSYDCIHVMNFLDH